MLIWAHLTLWHKSTIHSLFLSWHTASNFSSVLIVFRWFFNWLALGDLDYVSEVVLVTKANVVEGGIISPTWLYHQHNQSTHMTATSLPLTSNTSVAGDRLCQIALNQKLLCKFQKCCKFWSQVKLKSHKKKLCKTRLPVFPVFYYYKHLHLAKHVSVTSQVNINYCTADCAHTCVPQRKRTHKVLVWCGAECE